MPAITKCPKCQKAVTVPDGVNRASRVRCPFCQAEFPVGDALPPELIPLETAPTMEAFDLTAKPAESVVVSEASPGQPNAEKRRRSKSPVRLLLEVVLGGLLGCAAAYYLLALCMGPNFKKLDLPKLPLPGIEWLTTPDNKLIDKR
ncbi:MAG: IBR domain-containing protein [Thermoguttaceae bacterium]